MELDALQDHVAAWIGEHELFDSIAVAGTAAGDDERRHSVGDRLVGAVRVTFLFGEETVPIGDDEPEIAGASLIDARKVDLVEDPMT